MAALDNSERLSELVKDEGSTVRAAHVQLRTHSSRVL